MRLQISVVQAIRKVTIRLHATTAQRSVNFFRCKLQLERNVPGIVFYRNSLSTVVFAEEVVVFRWIFNSLIHMRWCNNIITRSFMHQRCRWGMSLEVLSTMGKPYTALNLVLLTTIRYKNVLRFDKVKTLNVYKLRTKTKTLVPSM